MSESNVISQSGSLLTDAEIEPIDQFRREHKTAVLVVMFTDLKGSTELAEERGELHSQEIRKQHDRMLREIVERDGYGSVIKTIGDSLMCVFAEPSTAVQRAVEIQQLLHDYNRQHADEADMGVRIGIHMGQVTVEDSLRFDVFGRHVNRAARVEGLADAGQILTTLPVYDSARGWLAEQHVLWHDHGDYHLKGIDEPVRVYEVCPSCNQHPRPPKGQRFSRRVDRRFWFLAICALIAIPWIAVSLYSANLNQPGSNDQSDGSPVPQFSGKRAVPLIAVVQLIENPLLDLALNGITDELNQQGLHLGLHYTTRRYNAGGNESEFQNIIKTILQEQPDVVLTLSTPAMIAVAKGIKEIPIVFCVASDPRRVGVYEGQNRPKNLVGVHDDPPLEQLIDLATRQEGAFKTVGTIWHSSEPNSELSARKLAVCCEKKELTLLQVKVDEIDQLFSETSKLCKDGAEVIVISVDNLTTTGLPLILDAAGSYNVPIYSTEPSMVKQGIAGAVGDDPYAWGKQSGRLLAELLKGKRPDQLPIESTMHQRTVIAPEE